MMQRSTIVALSLLTLLFCLSGNAQAAQTTPRPAGPRTASTAANVQQLFVAGETALRAGDLATAKKSFGGFLKQAPHMAGAYENLGVIAMRRHQWSQALTLLNRAEKLAPTVAGIRLNIGLVHFRENDFSAAIPPLVSVVKDQPTSSQARYLLGLCYFFTDRPADAVDTLEPLWAEQSGQLSYLYVLGNAATAANRKPVEQKAFSQLVEIGGHATEFHLFMGKAHLNREEFAQAVSELKTAVEMNPHLPFAHFNLGLAYSHNEDYEHARHEFLTYIAFDPEVAFSYH